MARKGLWRRFIDGITNVIKRPTPGLPPVQPPSPTSTVFSLRRQAIDSMSRLPMFNIDHVTSNVQSMSIDELRWTTQATTEQLRWRARQDADRLDINIPLNPWWYH